MASDWDRSVKGLQPGIRLKSHIPSTQVAKSAVLAQGSCGCRLCDACWPHRALVTLHLEIRPATWSLSSVLSTVSQVCVACIARAEHVVASVLDPGALSCNCSSRTSCVQMPRSLNAVQLCPPDFGVSCTSMFLVGARPSRAIRACRLLCKASALRLQSPDVPLPQLASQSFMDALRHGRRGRQRKVPDPTRPETRSPEPRPWT